VIASGTPEALLKNNTDQVQQFMQGLPDGPVPFHFSDDDMLEDLCTQERW
jgi:phospholipid/cholesterol/gamma-HCH transport system ATP-binding protein